MQKFKSKQQCLLIENNLQKCPTNVFARTRSKIIIDIVEVRPQCKIALVAILMFCLIIKKLFKKKNRIFYLNKICIFDIWYIDIYRDVYIYKLFQTCSTQIDLGT